MRIFPVLGAAAAAMLIGGCGPQGDGDSPGMQVFRCPAVTR
jgi:hypothetical protein